MISSLHAYFRSGADLRRRLVVPLFLLILAIGLTGCGPKIKITWSEPKSEITEGTLLRIAGAEVGKVTDVATDHGLFSVEARIYRKAKDQVRSESAFVLKKPGKNTPTHIEIVTLRAESGPIADGAIYKGAEHQLDVLYQSLSSDWPRTLTIIAVAKGVLLLGLMCFRQLRQLAAVLFCLGAGVAGAYYASPYAQSHLQRWVPVDFRPDLLAYVAGFLAAYIAALILVTLIRAPFAASRE
jgi:hypothetical protein